MIRYLIIGILLMTPAAFAQSPDDLQRQLAVQQRLAEINELQANAPKLQVLLEYWQAEAQRLEQENEALKQELEEQEACEPSSSD